MQLSSGRERAAQWNAARRSIGALVGIAQGILADGVVETAELVYLRQWIVENGDMATAWPGSVIYAKIQEIAAEGSPSAEDRAHFAVILRKLIGGDAADLAEASSPTQLGLDDVDRVEFDGSTFCFTGEFVFGPRSTCEQFTQRRGGIVQSGITKKLRYLVVGGMGSAEWKGGSFGNKIMKAQQYKYSGVPILIVHEDIWSNSMNGG